MALNAYFKASSPSRGWIKGSVTQKGREGLIRIVRSDHLHERVLNLASFTIAATPQHHPFLVVKEVDAASIGLRGCLIDNETLSEWRLQYWMPNQLGSAQGVEVQYFTVELTGARVQAIRHVMPDVRDRTLADWREYEEVAFVYDKIKWTYTTGAKTVSDEIARGAPRIPITRKRRR